MKNGGSNPPAPGNRCAEPPGGLSSRSGGFDFPPDLTLRPVTGSQGTHARGPRHRVLLPPPRRSDRARPSPRAANCAGRGHHVTILTSHMRGEDADPPFVRRVGTSRVIYSNGAFARITTGWRLTGTDRGTAARGRRGSRPRAGRARPGARTAGRRTRPDAWDSRSSPRSTAGFPGRSGTACSAGPCSGGSTASRPGSR